jgi:hypothetical protein
LFAGSLQDPVNTDISPIAEPEYAVVLKTAFPIAEQSFTLEPIFLNVQLAPPENISLNIQLKQFAYFENLLPNIEAEQIVQPELTFPLKNISLTELEPFSFKTIFPINEPETSFLLPTIMFEQLISTDKTQPTTESETPSLPPTAEQPAPAEQSTRASQKKSTKCSLLTLRHIEAGGVGYEHGYTTFTGLAFLSDNQNKIRPFVDVRGHEFNNNTQAANVGFGVRFASSRLQKAFGINAYYDYRNTHYGSYNQVSFGFEFLGERVDLRFNGYIPFGKKSHTAMRCFFHFPGGFSMSRKKTEIALGGANLEVGMLITKIHSTSFYAAAGPYYFDGAVCQHVFGGEFRFNITFNKYFFIEGQISHDNVFETKVQGIVGFSLPLGCKSSKSPKRQFPEEMLTQPIQRHEIIVLKNKCRWEKNF